MCKEIHKKTMIPYSCLVVVSGIILSLAPRSDFVGKSVTIFEEIGVEELLYVFIPLLIFEAGFNSNLFVST